MNPEFGSGITLPEVEFLNALSESGMEAMNQCAESEWQISVAEIDAMKSDSEFVFGICTREPIP